MKETEVVYDFIPVDASELSGDEWQQAGGVNAIELLKQDHRKVQGLLQQYMQSKNSREKDKLCGQIAMELRIHSQIEEKLVYPDLKEEDEGEADEAYTEHALVAFMLDDIEKTKGDRIALDAKVKVLNELVKHHVKEEETVAMPTLQKSGIDLMWMGQQVTDMKQKLQKQMQSKGKRSTAAKSSSSKRTATKQSSARKATSKRSASAKK